MATLLNACPGRIAPPAELRSRCAPWRYQYRATKICCVDITENTMPVLLADWLLSGALVGLRGDLKASAFIGNAHVFVAALTIVANCPDFAVIMFSAQAFNSSTCARLAWTGQRTFCLLAATSPAGPILRVLSAFLSDTMDRNPSTPAARGTVALPDITTADASAGINLDTDGQGATDLTACYNASRRCYIRKA
ncbi:hypothetical protein H2202_009781 [Exophiala xenobiotica]|nr:hypothetical protein H2202_009781 [Exophiala xenobiotica]